jgi:hypothetical protein
MPSLRDAPGALWDIPAPDEPAEPADIPFSPPAAPPPRPWADAKLTPASSAAVVIRNLFFILLIMFLLRYSLAFVKGRAEPASAYRVREPLGKNRQATPSFRR